MIEEKVLEDKQKESGEILVSLRELSGISKYRLQINSGIDRATILKMENGKQNFGVKHLIKYLAGIGINLVDIICQEQDC